jgi:DNA-3-methyladenine glycosylase I
MRRRCAWAAEEPNRTYHDREWGVPERRERRLFELLVLEGAQAGLSWTTILKKRPAYRRAFAGFDPARVARFGPGRVRRLLADPGIVRHRGKIEGAIANARALLALRRAEGSFARFLWAFVDGRPVQRRPRTFRDVPAATPTSRALSRALRRRGFCFVGPTICYAFMQAAGLVNDHTADCFRRRPVERLAGAAAKLAGAVAERAAGAKRADGIKG